MGGKLGKAFHITVFPRGSTGRPDRLSFYQAPTSRPDERFLGSMHLTKCVQLRQSRHRHRPKYRMRRNPGVQKKCPPARETGEGGWYTTSCGNSAKTSFQNRKIVVDQRRPTNNRAKQIDRAPACSIACLLRPGQTRRTFHTTRCSV